MLGDGISRVLVVPISIVPAGSPGLGFLSWQASDRWGLQFLVGHLEVSLRHSDGQARTKRFVGHHQTRAFRLWADGVVFAESSFGTSQAFVLDQWFSIGNRKPLFPKGSVRSKS